MNNLIRCLATFVAFAGEVYVHHGQRRPRHRKSIPRPPHKRISRGVKGKTPAREQREESETLVFTGSLSPQQN